MRNMYREKCVVASRTGPHMFDLSHQRVCSSSTGVIGPPPPTGQGFSETPLRKLHPLHGGVVWWLDLLRVRSGFLVDYLNITKKFLREDSTWS